MSIACPFYVLVETAAGYILLDIVEFDEIASMTPEMQRALGDAANFLRCVKLKVHATVSGAAHSEPYETQAFIPFVSAEMALENISEISEHGVPGRLVTFLQQNLPKISGKKKKIGKKQLYVLGVVEPDLGKAIAESMGASIRSDDVVREIIRAARQHVARLVPGLGNGVLEQSQLGLGHAFSRAKVKFNPARADNMIIQSIGLLDTLDKDINKFAMRCREWYSWHFPELRDMVRDNYAFARAAAVIGDRTSFLSACADETTGVTKMAELADAVRDRTQTADEPDDGVALAESIRSAARMSMGMDCSAGDMANIMHFTQRMVSLATYRLRLGTYLGEKMYAVAPNLATLVGESVGARLISKAGSLSSLAKCPASTVQILGAEKALFRALKKKGNTPKYGLIYHSTFIGRASKKNKGRISRYLANKCAIASRIDAFAEELTSRYGEQMREQVEERLRFFDTGATPRKNIDVMTQVASQLAAETKLTVADTTHTQGTLSRELDGDDKPGDSAKMKKKKKTASAERDTTSDEKIPVDEHDTSKKSKKKGAEMDGESPKKKKKAAVEGGTPSEAKTTTDSAEKSKKKRKKKEIALDFETPKKEATADSETGSNAKSLVDPPSETSKKARKHKETKLDDESTGKKQGLSVSNDEVRTKRQSSGKKKKAKQRDD